MIVAGQNPGDTAHGTGALTRLRRTLSLLGANWSYQNRRRVFSALPRVHVLGYDRDPRGLAGQSDLVLGMGRVLLEGLAAGKPVVLIGYDRLCGLVTAENLEAFSRSNFSGRGLAARTPAEVCDALARLPQGWQAPDLSAVDARRWGAVLASTVDGLTYRGEAADEELARDVARAPAAGHDASLFRSLAARLAAQELETLYRIAEG
jgi:hypothetical protein